MNKDFISRIYGEHQRCPGCPSASIVGGFFEEILATFFPDYSKLSFNSIKEFELHLDKLKIQLEQVLFRNPATGNLNAEEAAETFFGRLEDIYHKLHMDVTAMFEGDPAAKSEQEVIRTYPGFYAIAAYRVAHELRKIGVREIPRMITELAHSRTGIDINPGAVIGESFCIDHGTGIVIGETTVIGNHVKIYQGVTLGALSVEKEDAEKKRHPTIEDNVVIYAGATILGGETVIGHDSVIGGNVWLTRSIEPFSKVYYQAKMHNPDTGETDTIIYKTQV